MKQLLFGAAGGTLATGATRYLSVEGMGVVADVNPLDNVIAEAGTLSHLRVELDVAPGASKDYTFTVMKNGVATSLAVTISGTSTVGEDSTNTVSLAANDHITLRAVPTGTPTAALPRWATQFEATTAQRAIWTTGLNNQALEPSGTRYNTFGVPATVWASSVTDADCIWGIDCTIKSLYVYLTGAPGVGAEYAFTIMKNGVAEASSTVTIADAATTGNVTGLSIDVAPGDKLALRCVPTGGPPNWGALWGASYEPDTDGQWNWSGRAVTTTDGYHYAATGPALNQDTLASRTALAGAAAGSIAWSVSGVRVDLATAPGTSQSRVYTVVKNGVDTVATVTISGTATSGSGGSAVPFESGDTWSLHIDDSAGAALSVTRWSYGAGFGGDEEDPDPPVDVDQHRLMLSDGTDPDVPTDDITAQNGADGGQSLFKFERGRSRAIIGEPPVAGRGSCTLNNTIGMGLYALDAPAPGLAIRLNKKYNGVWFHMFQGNIDVPQHSMSDPPEFRPKVALTAFGPLSKLANKKVSTALYKSQTTGVLIGHLLDAAGFPAFLRDLDAGEVTHPYWWASDEDAMSALIKLLNSEGITSELYEDGQGRLVFRSRSARYTESRSADIQTTFTSEGAEPRFTGFTYESGFREIINYASHERIPRTDDASPSVVWTDSNGAGNYLIVPNGTLVLEAVATEPFFDAITPVLNTDYANGFGTVTPTLERTSGQRTKITFTAGAGGALIGPVGVNDGIQLRATTTIAGPTFIETSAIDADDSIDAYGLRPWNGAMNKELEWDDMRDNLDAIVSLKKDPRGRIRFGLNAARGGIELSAANEATAKRDIGDRVRVVYPDLDFDGECWIEKIEHEVFAPAGTADGTAVGREFTYYECSVVSLAVGSGGTGVGEANPYDAINNEDFIGPPTLGDQGVTTTKAIMAGAL